MTTPSTTTDGLRPSDRINLADESESCWKCGGEGCSHHDCGEDCCCCADPINNITCDICNGKGVLTPAPTTDGLRPSDRTELAQQIFEFSCAQHGYAYDWSKQDIKTIGQWTTIADFILEREKSATEELQYFRKFRDELQAANTKLVLENRQLRAELEAANVRAETALTFLTNAESGLGGIIGTIKAYLDRDAKEEERLAALKEGNNE